MTTLSRNARVAGLLYLTLMTAPLRLQEHRKRRILGDLDGSDGVHHGDDLQRHVAVHGRLRPMVAGAFEAPFKVNARLRERRKWMLDTARRDWDIGTQQRCRQ